MSLLSWLIYMVKPVTMFITYGVMRRKESYDSCLAYWVYGNSTSWTSMSETLISCLKLWIVEIVCLKTTSVKQSDQKTNISWEMPNNLPCFKMLCRTNFYTHIQRHPSVMLVDFDEIAHRSSTILRFNVVWTLEVESVLANFIYLRWRLAY